MNGIDIKLLHAFVTVVDMGSYSNAAKALFITQPALSKQIQSLEKLIGGHLFIRGRHGANLTVFGAQLFTKANEILQSHIDFLNYAKQLSKSNDKKLYIGFGVSSFQCVPIITNKFRQQYPECEVVINQLPSSEQMNMLLKGSLHLGFVRMPVIKSLSSRMIYVEKLVLAVPSHNNIKLRTMQDALSSYPLFQLEPLASPCLAEQTALFLQKNQLNAVPVSVMGDMTALLALVAGRNGVAFLPESVQHFLPNGVELIIPPQNQTLWNIGVAWNASIHNIWRDDFLKVLWRDLFMNKSPGR